MSNVKIIENTRMEDFIKEVELFLKESNVIINMNYAKTGETDDQYQTYSVMIVYMKREGEPKIE